MEKNTFGGFQAISDFLSSPGSNPSDGFDDPIVEGSSSVDLPNPDDNEPIIPDPSQVDDNIIVPPIKPVEPTVPPTTPVTPTEPTTPVDDLDLSEEEPLIASYLQEKLYDRFGWELGADEPKLNSVDDIVEFLKTVVEESSIPTYASSEIEKLNEYVANGGKIENYLEQRYSGNLDLTNLRLNNAAEQTLVLREYFKRQGFNSNLVEKKIQKYEDTGILEDEAREAYDLLKKSVEKESQTLLEEQKKVKDANQKRQQDYYNSVVSYIESLQDVRGLPVSASDKKKLKDYMFKPSSDGETQFKRDYESSVKPFIEAAFFTMNGEALVNKMNKKASSEAVKALKSKLETKTKRNKSTDYLEQDKSTKGDYSFFTNVSNAIGSSQF
jgi:hypothetical protein